MDEILWSGDGWPYFRFGVIPTSQSPSPFGAESKEVINTYDEFNGTRLVHQWQWDLLHPPRIILEDGMVKISPQSSAAGNSGETVLGVLPKSGDYAVTTAVTNRNTAVKGLTAYGDRGNFLGFGISDNKLTLWKMEKSNLQVLRELIAPSSGEVTLKMTVRGGYIYRFYWSTDGKTWRAVHADEEGKMEDINGSYLPPWDRAPRAGLIVKGRAGEEGVFA